MESISSLELKDLFHKCPRLKSKLSGQELRAISDTIDQRVRIQHSQLLAKITRLEMYQSALYTRKSQFLELDAKGLKSIERIPEVNNEKDLNRHDRTKASERPHVTFALPQIEKNTYPALRYKIDQNDARASTEESEKFPSSSVFTQTKKELSSTDLVSNYDNVESKIVTGLYNNSKEKTITKSVKKQPRDMSTIDITRENMSYTSTFPNASISISNDKSNVWIEEMGKKDLLIQNLTREIDFIKTILNDRSDYDRILQESIRQQRLIDQLKIELSTKRKDIVDLMKDIQRMRYALPNYSHHSYQCHELENETSSCNHSKLKPDCRRPTNEGVIESSGREMQTECCNSVLVSSQYKLIVGCGNPANCPWKKQLTSCNIKHAKKHQKNATLNCMLIQTKETLPVHKIKS